MPNARWDRVPVYGWFYDAPDRPTTGKVKFKIIGAPNGVKRADGTAIYRAGKSLEVNVGPEHHDVDARNAIRQAMRNQAEAAQGVDFDGIAWDAAWDAALPALIVLTFPATDDPDITPMGFQVEVDEQIPGGKKYPIDLPRSITAQPIPALNLSSIEIPPGTASDPLPTYAKGQAGGIAALDADGDVNDAQGNKITGGGGTGGTDLTSYTQVSGLVDYPATFPADLSGLATVASTGAYGDLSGLPTIPPAYDDTALSGRVTDLENDPGPDLSGYVVTTDPRLSDDRDPNAHTHAITDLTATGTPSDTTFLRGDGTWATPPDGGGAGVTDHGALTGLTDDDHPQYLNTVRGDARYAQATHQHTAAQISDSTVVGRLVVQASSATAARDAIGAGTSSLALGTGPTTAAAGDHGHTLNETTDTASRVAMTPAERAKLSGVETEATANSTDAQLRDRATHTGAQAVSTVTGLQDELDGKASTAHTHGVTDMTATGTPTSTTFLRGDNVWAAPAGGTSGTDLGWINVKDDFGAVGDGIADDGPAIQAALDAADVAGGGVVYFPPGSYITNQTLVQRRYTHIVGCETSSRYWGYATTTVPSMCSLRVGNSFVGASLLTTLTNTTASSLSNITLRGANRGTGIHGIEFNRSGTESNYIVQNVGIMGFTGDGLRGGLHVARFFNFFIGGNHGWGINFSGSWTDTHFLNGYVAGNILGGLNMDAPSHTGMIDFTGVRFERSGWNSATPETPIAVGSPGIRMRRALNARFVNCSTDANSGHALDIGVNAGRTYGDIAEVDFVATHFKRDGFGDTQVLGDYAGVRLAGLPAQLLRGVRFTSCSVGTGNAVDGGAGGIIHPRYGIWADDTTGIEWTGGEIIGSVGNFHTTSGTFAASNQLAQFKLPSQRIATVPSGSTGSRPTAALRGLHYYDTTLDQVMVHTGTAWEPVMPVATVTHVYVATGSEARPDYPVVMWIGGTTQPTNMGAGDVWFEEVV